MLTVSQALNLVLENTPLTTKITKKSLLDAKYFSLAEDIVADRDYPPFPRATMDGYAINESDLITEKEFTVIDEIFAGDKKIYPELLAKNSAVKIMTGAPVPFCFDTVIKVEDTTTNKNKVQIHADKIYKGMNIAKQGEDAKKGDVLINSSNTVDDSILTIAASLGYTELKVFLPPRISLISTGNEVLPEGVIPLPHQIRDSNSFTLRSMLNKFQADVVRCWNLPDDPQVLVEKFLECFDSDICIITGGVSAGDADYIPSTLKGRGVEEIFHKVLIRPGKPIWFGKKENTLFFGLPGNPVSARITFKVFVEPCIRKFLHQSEQIPYYLPIIESRKKKHDMKEYFRVKIVNQDNSSYLQEIPNNGSGDFIGSLGSDGIAVHPAENKDLPQYSKVKFLQW